MLKNIFLIIRYIGYIFDKEHKILKQKWFAKSQMVCKRIYARYKAYQQEQCYNCGSIIYRRYSIATNFLLLPVFRRGDCKNVGWGSARIREEYIGTVM